MATEFVSTTDPTVQFVRFFGGASRGVCFEFGTVTNFERVCTSADNGSAFWPNTGPQMPGDPNTRQDFERLCREGRVTFGEFPVTVCVGTGELFRFTVEE